MTKTVAADEVAYLLDFGFQTENWFGEWDIFLTVYGDGFVTMNAYMLPTYDQFGMRMESCFEDVELDHEEITIDSLQRKIEDLLEAENERAYEAAMDRYYGG